MEPPKPNSIDFNMDMILIPLALIYALKSTAIINAVRWIKRDGIRYRDNHRGKNPQSRDDWYDLFRDSNGAFIPFGVKDYKLRRYVERHHCTLAKVALIFQSLFFRYNRLVMICSTTLCLIVYLSHANDHWLFVKSGPLGAICLAFSLCIIGTNILLAFEAIYSYVVLGSYAILFHMLGVGTKSNQNSSEVLLEIKVLRDRLLVSLVSGATACFIAHIQYDAFTGTALVSLERGEMVAAIAAILQFAYFTMTTMLTIGYGDIAPKNGIGQFVATFLMAQGFSILVLAFSFLMAMAGSNDSRNSTSNLDKD